MSSWAVSAGGLLYLLAALDIWFFGGSGMGAGALWLCAALYCVAVASYCRQRDYGMAFAFCNYASSCVGLIYGWMGLVFLNYALANAGIASAGKK